jgi:hypothetical protein
MTVATVIVRDVLRTIVVVNQGTGVEVRPNVITQIIGGARLGPRGPQGLPGDQPFHFEQPDDDPLSVWTIHHNRDAHPTVVLRDETGQLMIARFDYQDTNTVTVSFPSPQSGTAELIF